MATSARIGFPVRTAGNRAGPKVGAGASYNTPGPSRGAAALDAVQDAIKLFMTLRASRMEREDRLAKEQKDEAYRQAQLKAAEEMRAEAVKGNAQEQAWKFIENMGGQEAGAPEQETFNRAGMSLVKQMTLPGTRVSPMAGLPSERRSGLIGPPDISDTPAYYSPSTTKIEQSPTGKSLIPVGYGERERIAEANRQAKAHQEAMDRVIAQAKLEATIRNYGSLNDYRDAMAQNAATNAAANASRAQAGWYNAQTARIRADAVKAQADQVSKGLTPAQNMAAINAANTPRNPGEVITEELFWQRYIAYATAALRGTSAVPPMASQPATTDAAGKPLPQGWRLGERVTP